MYLSAAFELLDTRLQSITKQNVSFKMVIINYFISSLHAIPHVCLHIFTTSHRLFESVFALV